MSFWYKKKQVVRNLFLKSHTMKSCIILFDSFNSVIFNGVSICDWVQFWLGSNDSNKLKKKLVSCSNFELLFKLWTAKSSNKFRHVSNIYRSGNRRNFSFFNSLIIWGKYSPLLRLSFPKYCHVRSPLFLTSLKSPKKSSPASSS